MHIYDYKRVGQGQERVVAGWRRTKSKGWEGGGGVSAGEEGNFQV